MGLSAFLKLALEKYQLHLIVKTYIGLTTEFIGAIYKTVEYQNKRVRDISFQSNLTMYTETNQIRILRPFSSRAEKVLALV